MNHSLIPLTGMTLIEFTPTAFRPEPEGEPDGPTPKFYISVPTFAMRDKMAAILFQRGFIPATQAQSRGILIDALYTLHDEATADENASFLEEYWVKEEVHTELTQAWAIREAQRLFDIAQGVTKPLEQEPVPPAPYTMRDQARHASIVTNALEQSQRFRSYQARFMVAQEEEQEMLIRLFLTKWEGTGDVLPVRDEMGLLTLPCIEAVRQWLKDAGAADGWDEVVKTVLQQFGGSGVLEKNFDLPLGLNSSQTGSQIPSGDLGISDGSLTTSSITPTPASKSRTPSAASRASQSGKRGRTKRTAGKRSGPTAAASSTSQSA